MKTQPRRDGPETGDINDPRIQSYMDAKTENTKSITLENGMRIACLPPIPAGESPHHYDAYHTYQYLRMNSVEKPYQATVPWATIFDSSPEARRPDAERYVIICDHRTGMRVRVTFPSVDDTET